MSTNGHDDDAGEIYRRHFCTEQAYRQRAAEASETAARLRAQAEQLAASSQHYVELEARLRAKAAQAAGEESGLHRSAMTPAQKSKFIRAQINSGLSSEAAMASYAALPW